MKHLVSTVSAVILTLALILCTGAAFAPVESLGKTMRSDDYSVGDVNDDGDVNAIDAFLIKSKIACGEEINDGAADMNADSKVTSADAFYLKSCLAGAKNLSDYDSEKTNFLIAGSPISDFEIVYDQDFVMNADNATACGIVLRTYIKDATGVLLDDVIGESNRTKPHMIRVIRMDPLASADERMDLGLEDYIYEVKDGDLYIYGTLRGNMYAAYEIVEKYLGYRFYTYREIFKYEVRAADLPEGLYEKHEVQIEWRYSGQRDSSDPRFWTNYYASRQNSTFIWGGGEARVGYTTGSMFDSAHSFLSTYQMGKAYDALIASGKTDEEIRSDLWACWSYSYQFAHDVSWEPCASDYGEGSDFEYMVKGMFLLQDLKAYEDADFRIELGINKVTFSHNDNTNGCTCKYCRAKYSGNTLKRVSQKLADTLTDGYTGEYIYDAAKQELTFKRESFTGAYLDFVNKGARAFREKYPTAEVWTIIYDHSIPESVRPLENISILYCGHGCMQHPLGSGECGDDLTSINGSNKLDEATIKWWADTVHAEGGHIWFWSYGVSYNYYFAPCPDIMDEWNNFHYLYEELGFDGSVYEGCGSCSANFEYLKSYMAVKMMWEPDMTYDEFIDYMKEFLYMYYGDGYEYIYDYIQLQQAAGDATGHCFITNHDRPWDYYSWQYLAEHYDEMRALLEKAYALADTEDRQTRIQLLIYSCDFMGICSSWDVMYLNGSDESIALCEERLTELYNYFEETERPICGSYSLPEELTFDECPMNLFYSFGAWRAENIPYFAK